MAYQDDPLSENDPAGAPENTKKQATTKKISHWVERVHSWNTFQLLAGICQLILGTLVVGLSVLQLIQPLWLSTIVSIIASVTTMTGIYFCYSAITYFQEDTLLRNAMRRIVEDQN